MIVFDNETTGLVKPEIQNLEKQPKIIEFAAIKLNDDTLEEVDRLEFLVQPGHKLPEEIVKITGIKDTDLVDAKPFAAHYKKMAEFFFGEKKMVAHNCAFDRNMIMFELQRLGKLLNFPWPIEHICTAEISMNVKGYRMKLSDLHEMAVGEKFAGAHRAMVDVEALVRVVKWLRKEHKAI